jgi:hypothetical protein
VDVSVICTRQAYFSSDFYNLIIYFFRFITCHWLVNFQVYYLPLIGYVSGLFLAIDWLFFRFITCHWFVIFQVYYLPLIGYFSGLLLAIGWLFFRFITCHWLVIFQVYYLPLIGYFSGLLLAVSSVLQSVYTTNYIHHISIGQKYFCEGANHHCSWTFSKLYYSFVTMLLKRLSWSWLYGSWIYKYLCNLPITTKVSEDESSSWRDVLDTTLCDKFVSDLIQISGFLPPPIKLTATI